MSPENMEDTHQPESDPLLTPGAFISPHPSPNGTTDPMGTPPQPQPQQQSDQQNGSGLLPGEVTDESRKPTWLPPGWRFVERVRASGSSAGSKDKYFVDPVSRRSFRSRKEVMRYLETGSPHKGKRKSSDSDADNTAQANSESSKRKKSEARAKSSMNNFKFDDAPGKVKWALTDVYEGTWRPLNNGVDRVPESSKQEWAAAFTYLTLQNGGTATF